MRFFLGTGLIPVLKLPERVSSVGMPVSQPEVQRATSVGNGQGSRVLLSKVIATPF